MLVQLLIRPTIYRYFLYKIFQKNESFIFNSIIINNTKLNIINDLIINFVDNLDFGGFLKNINNNIINQKKNVIIQPIIKA